MCALLGASGIAVLSGGTAAANVFVHCPANNLQTAINAAPSGTMIIVDGTCVGNFTVPAGKTITLNGPAVLDGNHAGTVLQVQSTATAKLISITVQNGAVGGINNGGTLTADYALVKTNISPNPGAAIANSGKMTVTNSIITGNTARVGGGAIANFNSGVATISASTIDHNNGGTMGGGILNTLSGTMTVLGSFVTNNDASQGGGIFNNSNAGPLTVRGTHVDNNNQQGGTAGGGVWNDAVAAVNSATVNGNTSGQGGGIFNGVNGNLTLRSSVVNGDTATGGAGSGGGVRNLGTIKFPASNIAGNTPDNCVGC